jgi:hypothetical protein
MYDRQVIFLGTDQAWAEGRMKELSFLLPNAFIYAIPYYDLYIERMMIFVRINDKTVTLMERSIFEQLEIAVRR